jgi:hypothetical protein
LTVMFYTRYLRSWRDVRNKSTEFSSIELSSKSSTNYYTSLQFVEKLDRQSVSEVMKPGINTPHGISESPTLPRV